MVFSIAAKKGLPGTGQSPLLAAPADLTGGAWRESEPQGTLGIGAVRDQLCDAVRQRAGSARSGPGNTSSTLCLPHIAFIDIQMSSCSWWRRSFSG